MRYLVAIVAIVLAAQSWAISLEDRFVLDLYNKSVNKNLDDAEEIASMNCRDGSSRLANLVLNRSQKGDVSETLNISGLLLAILKVSNAEAYAEAKEAILDGDLDSLDYMFDFDGQGIECTKDESFKDVFNSSYVTP